MNNFNLERADLLQLEPITNRGTLKLLPLGKKNKVNLKMNNLDVIFCSYKELIF